MTGTLRRDDGGPARFLAALAAVHVRGVPVNWAAVLGGGQQVDLPTYAFRRQRYWPQPAPATSEAHHADWRYRVSWVPVPEPDRTPLPGTWLLVTPPGQHRNLPGQLAARGAQVLLLEATAQLSRDALAARIGEVLAGAGDPPLSGVLSLLALDEAPLAEFPAVPRGLAGTLTLVQALGDAGIQAPLWVLTQGAAGDPVASPVQAMAWGLGRVAGLEHPGRWGGLIDLPPSWDEKAADRLCAVLAGGGEDQVAIRPGGVLTRRLVRAGARRAGRPRWVAAGDGAGDRGDRRDRPVPGPLGGRAGSAAGGAGQPVRPGRSGGAGGRDGPGRHRGDRRGLRYHRTGCPSRPPGLARRLRAEAVGGASRRGRR